MAVETPNRKGLQLAKWSNMVSALLADEPELLEGLPDEFQLVTLPQQEPELWPYALGLVEPRGTTPVVYALIEVLGSSSYCLTARRGRWVK